MMSHGCVFLTLSWYVLTVILPLCWLLQTAAKGCSVLLCQILAKLQNRGEWLLSGQLDPLVQDFSFPLPIYVGAKRIVLTSADQAMSFCEVIRTAFCDRGMVALRPKITALELPRGGRFRVWVDWDELALPVTGTRLTSAVYYMQAGPNGLRTEMIVYQGLSLPEVCIRFQEMALSA